MARPKKKGLDYFPFDVDFFDDPKIEAVSGEFGLKGELAVIKLLCSIYRDGYYTQWNEQLKLKLCRRLPGVSSELMEQIVLRLVRWGFFDKTLFDSAQVLTSAGIQERYLKATSRRSGSTITVYACINGVIVDKNPSNVGINVSKNPQSKVKESKGDSMIITSSTLSSQAHQPKTIGKGENFILVNHSIGGGDTLRIEGESGLQELFEMNCSALRDQQYARKFMRANHGKPYHDFPHVFNDYKQFCAKQF